MKKCKCKGCFSDAICRDGHCAKHTRAKRNKRSYSCRTSPRSSKAHLGIEIECFADDDMVHDAMLSQSVVPCSDGSLPSLGCEFKICREGKAAIKRAVRLVTKLNAAGARVNKKCGLHVHLDCRSVTYPRRLAFVKWMKANQDWFFSLFPRSRRPGNNHFITRIDWAESTDHYQWCHITGYNTIEIRIHGGTLNRHKLIGWLSACKDLLDLLRSEAEFPAMEMVGRKASQEWIAKVFKTAIAAEYITARQDANGVLESFEEVGSCAD